MRFINFLGETRDRKSMVMTSDDGIYYTVSKEEVMLVLQAIAESRMHYTTIEEREQMLHYDLSPRKKQQIISEAPSDEEIGAFRDLVETLDTIISATDEKPADSRSKLQSVIDRVAVLADDLSRDSITEAVQRTQSRVSGKLGDVIARVQSRLSDVLVERGTADDEGLKALVRTAKSKTLKDAKEGDDINELVIALIKTGNCNAELTAVYLSVLPDVRETIMGYYMTFLTRNPGAFDEMMLDQAVQVSSKQWMDMVGKFL